MKLLTLIFLLFTGTVSAQTTHPCDLTPPTVFRYPSAQLSQLRVAFCFKPEDTYGLPIEGEIGFKLDIDGVGSIDLGPVQPSPIGPNANGDYYYEVQTSQLAAGQMHLHAYSLNGDSASSELWTLTLLGPPKPPKKGAVIQIRE
jgi:hypothetical protein